MRGPTLREVRHLRSRLVEIAEFISFGTNDLTQMAFGISRDDAEKAFLVQ